MSKHLTTVAVAMAATLGAPAFALPLTEGNLFVYRVGTGSAALSSAATAVFVDEYSKLGTLVQSIALPTAAAGANGMLTASGSATSEGLLTLSADHQYLMLTGYNAAPGVSGVAATSTSAVARTVGAVSVKTGSIDTSTKLTTAGLGGNNIRGVASTDGSALWVSTASNGVSYTTKGSSTATQVSSTVGNTRAVEIANGQLYTSTGSGSTVRLGAIGTGTPSTSGQVITNLPGFGTSGSPYAFYFADLDAGVAGVDTLYVADDSSGITKYSLSGGTWSAKGTVGNSGSAYRGLTGFTDAQGVHLFATSAASKLVSLTDASGYGGTFAATATTLATAAANTAFRGVAYLQVSSVPEPETYALMLAGLATVGLLARRRKA